MLYCLTSTLIATKINLHQHTILIKRNYGISLLANTSDKDEFEFTINNDCKWILHRYEASVNFTI